MVGLLGGSWFSMRNSMFNIIILIHFITLPLGIWETTIPYHPTHTSPHLAFHIHESYTNFALCPSQVDIASSHMTPCPSGHGPTLMPMVGTKSLDVMYEARTCGITSRTTENAPADWRARAECNTPLALENVLP